MAGFSAACARLPQGARLLLFIVCPSTCLRVFPSVCKRIYLGFRRLLALPLARPPPHASGRWLISACARVIPRPRSLVSRFMSKRLYFHAHLVFCVPVRLCKRGRVCMGASTSVDQKHQRGVAHVFFSIIDALMGFRRAAVPHGQLFRVVSSWYRKVQWVCQLLFQYRRMVANVAKSSHRYHKYCTRARFFLRAT